MTDPAQPSEHTPEELPFTSKTVATPEGDNEFAPDQALKPIDQRQTEDASDLR